MAVVTGLTGAVAVSGGTSTATTNCFNWSLSYEGAAVETTAFGDTTRKFIIGITEWSGSYKCRCDDTILIPAPGAITTLTLTASTNQTASGAAIITGVSEEVEFDGNPMYTVSFKGNGALTLA